jgi:putative membrane protein
MTGGFTPRTTNPVLTGGFASGVLSASENSLVVFVAEMHRGEVQLGALAEKRGDHPAVKSFARQMVQDHTVGLDDLGQLGSAAGEEVRRTSISAADQQLVSQLSSLAGSEFDRVYVSAMVTSHQAAVAALQEHARSLGSGTGYEHASALAAKVSAHLAQARDLATFVK